MVFCTIEENLQYTQYIHRFAFKKMQFTLLFEDSTVFLNTKLKNVSNSYRS